MRYEIGEQYTIRHGMHDGRVGKISKIDTSYNPYRRCHEARILVSLSPRYGVWCTPGTKDWA